MNTSQRQSTHQREQTGNLIHIYTSFFFTNIYTVVLVQCMYNIDHNRHKSRQKPKPPNIHKTIWNCSISWMLLKVIDNILTSTFYQYITRQSSRQTLSFWAVDYRHFIYMSGWYLLQQSLFMTLLVYTIHNKKHSQTLGPHEPLQRDWNMIGGIHFISISFYQKSMTKSFWIYTERNTALK